MSYVWIQTHSGKRFDLLDPTPEMVDSEDIAHALSQLCRYTGHCKHFYSVAQHCVHVSERVPPEFALAGLLHDAHEAYVGDVSSPLKKAMRRVVTAAGHDTEGFEAIDMDVAAVIAERFGRPAGLLVSPSLEGFSAVRRADLRMLETERRALLGPPPEEWDTAKYAEPYFDMRLVPWASSFAKAMWLRRLEELTNGR